MTMSFTTSKADMEAVLPKLVEDIAEYLSSADVPEQVVDRLLESMQVNFSGGKMFRALAVPEAARTLSKHPLLDQDIENLSILGCLVELWQAYLLVIDDIIDGSLTRRGKPCWYQRPNIGLVAINEGILLKSSIFILLRKYFEKHPAYVAIVDSFNHVTFMTEIGQECDALAARESRPDSWTLDQYEYILKVKGGYGSFYLSLLVVLHYLQLATPSNIQQTEDITLSIGKLYQYRNDYMDIFGMTEVTGKVGTDIKENKCSWVIIHALGRSVGEEREYLLNHYGTCDEEKAAEVQRILQNLDLTTIYKHHEKNMVSSIQDKITGLDTSEGLTGDVFRTLLTCDYR